MDTRAPRTAPKPSSSRTSTFRSQGSGFRVQGAHGQIPPSEAESLYRSSLYRASEREREREGGIDREREEEREREGKGEREREIPEHLERAPNHHRRVPRRSGHIPPSKTESLCRLSLYRARERGREREGEREGERERQRLSAEILKRPSHIQGTVSKSMVGFLPRKHASSSKLLRPLPGYPVKGRDLVLCILLCGTTRSSVAHESTPPLLHPGVSGPALDHSPRDARGPHDGPRGGGCFS